jgi:protein subunit release factor B
MKRIIYNFPVQLPFRFEDIPKDPRGLLRDCEVTFYRASGPGGQHRNKAETAVRIVHLPTRTTAVAAEERSQSQNREKALERLHAKLVRHFKPRKKRRPTTVSREAREKRLREKGRRARLKVERRRPEPD